MSSYRITYKPDGVDYGIYDGETEAEALLAMYRDAGYGPDRVWIDGDDVVFDSDETRAMAGGVDAWTIEDDAHFLRRALVARAGLGIDECDTTTWAAVADRVRATEPKRCEIPAYAPVAILPGWVACWDGLDIHYPFAASASDAAREYCDSADWGDSPNETTWLDILTWRAAVTVDDDGAVVRLRLDEEEHRFTIEPEEPECERADGHEWCSPFSLLGGIEENPGCWGHGGGVVIREVCGHCGVYRITDTWAQGPGGEQGLESVRYEPADEESCAWVSGRP